jgi:hypothetical protein
MESTVKIYLKVKIKSLAAEAGIIRKEEKRHRGEVRSQLHQHRVLDVRREARAAILACGFLRGRDYRRMEMTPRERPAWKRVEDLVKKYGQDDIRDRMQRFSEWRSAADTPN